MKIRYDRKADAVYILLRQWTLSHHWYSAAWCIVSDSSALNSWADFQSL